MEKNFNLSSLSTVHAPVEEYIKDIKAGLQTNLNKIKGEGKIPTEFKYLEIMNKMRNVFEMVGLNGLNKVILLVEEANKGLQEANFSTKTSISILEESLVLINSVEAYIKQLLDGSLDQPTRFFDNYQKLAKIIEIDVDIKDLFTPKLEVNSVELKNELKVGQYLNKTNIEDVKDSLEKITNKIVKNIDVILSKVSIDNLEDGEDKVSFKHSCKIVYDSLSDIQTLKLSKSYYVLAGVQKLLLCISAPFFNDQFKALAVNSLKEMKLNLALISETVEKYNEGVQALQVGKKTSVVKISDDVIKENLFFVINAVGQNPKLKQMPVFKELVAYFDYEFYEEQLSSDTIKATVMYQNNGLTEQLDNILFEIKKELVVITGEKHNEEIFYQHVTKFYVLNHKFWETIKLANGEATFKSFASSLVELTEKIKNKKVLINEDIKKELSLSIVWLEYAINNLIKKRVEQKVRLEFEKQLDLQEKRIRTLSQGGNLSNIPVPNLDKKSKDAEAKKAILKIYEEVERDLKLSEELLDSILRNQSLEDKDLDVVIKPLNSIKGIFLVLGNKELGEMVKELIRIWKCVQTNGLNSIPEEELKKSVVLFAGLSLFVTASRENNEYKSKEVEAKLIKEFKGEVKRIDVSQSKLVIPEGDSFVQEVVETPVKEVEEEIIIEKLVEAISIEEKDEVTESEVGVPVMEEKKIEVKPVNNTNENELITCEAPEDIELLEIYVEEVKDLALSAEQSIESLLEDKTLFNEIKTLRRVFHTYKGSGRIIGLDNIGEVAWAVEQKLNYVLERNETLNDTQLKALSDVNKCFIAWVDEISETHKLTFNVSKECEVFNNNYNGVNSHSDVIVPTIEEKETPVEMEIEVPVIDEIIVPAIEEKETPVEMEIEVPVIEDIIVPTMEEIETPVEMEIEVPVIEDIIVPTIEEIETPVEMEIEVPVIEDIIVPAIEEIETPVEMEIEVPVIEEIKIPTIGDVNVSVADEEIDDEMKEILEICKIEVTENLGKLENFIASDLEDTDNQYNLMRAAHTLSSLGKTLSLDNFANVVLKIEAVAEVMLEKNKTISGQSISEIKHIVKEIKEHNERYNDKDISEEKLQKYILTLLKIKSEVEGDGSESSSSVLDTDSIKEEVREAVKSLVLEPVDKKLTELNNTVEKQGKEMDELKKEIVLIKQDIDSIKKNTKRIKNEAIERLKSLQEEVGLMREPVKKKSNGYDFQLFQEELILLLIQKTDWDTITENLVSLISQKDWDSEEIEYILNELNDIEDLIVEVKYSIEQEEDRIQETELKEVILEEVASFADKEVSVQSSYDENIDVSYLLNIVNEDTVSCETIETKPEFNLENINILNNEIEDINMSKELYAIINDPIIKVIFDEKISTIIDEKDDEMLEIAIDEIEEKRQDIEVILETTISPDLDVTVNDTIKRHLHTLKGNYRMAGLNQLGTIAHRLESLLDYAEAHNIPLLTIKPVLTGEMSKINFLENNPLTADKYIWIDNISIDGIQVSNSNSEEVTVEIPFFMDNKPEEVTEFADVVSEDFTREEPELNNLIETLNKVIVEDKINSEIAYVAVQDVKEEKLVSKLTLEEILEDSLVANMFEEQISNIDDEFEQETYDIARDEINEKKIQINEILDMIGEKEVTLDVQQDLKRHLHTIKGSLRMAGLKQMGAVAHRLESLLDYAENHNVSLETIKPVLIFEFEKLEFLEEHRGNITKEKEDWLDSLFVVKKGEQFIEGKVKLKELDKKVVNKEEKERQNIKISSKVLDTLFTDAGEMRLTRITLEGSVINHKRNLLEMKSASKKMSSLLREIEIQAEMQIAAKKELEAEQGEGFDPLEFDRYTRLQELTRFMQEAVADIEESTQELEVVQKLQENTIAQQNIVSNNILSSIMHVRLVAVDSINDRLYKISRNTSKELGKQLILEISGEKTEIDRFVLDKVFDPLAHILRNCIAHGIELPEAREKAGKNRIGKINLDIKQEGNFIFITVSDDGAGINVKKVREKAIEKGLIKESDDLTNEEIIELIYRSGFSTADVVSQVSGRGVGMDIVKNEIFALGGNVKTYSTEGKGSIFKIVLPVSVATNQVIISTTMGKLVAIPAILVEQVLSVKANELEKAYVNGSLNVNNENLPVSYMGHLTGNLASNLAPNINPYNILVVVSHGEEKAIIHLDKLETTEEILIKPVGPYFGKIQGLLGATLLGDGRQGLVINPVLLREHYNEMISYGKKSKEFKKTFKVMVVDDANTVRRTSEKILKKYGFEVLLAVEGANALEIIQDNKPDIILSDIEMPIMNGFDLLKNLKANENYKKIPVIMITSRTADKHRNLAYELGCDGFLGKPYIEAELIENINKLLNK